MLIVVIIIIGYTLIFVIMLTMLWAGLIGAPFIPTPKKGLMASIKLAEIKEGETVYDLGCGDGRFLYLAAKITKAGKLIGYEISLLPYLIARIKKLFSQFPEKIAIKYQNYYQADLTPADVIYIFSLPKVMKRLEKKLIREMKPGSRVVSYAFRLPNKQADKIVKISEKSTSIFLYKY